MAQPTRPTNHLMNMALTLALVATVAIGVVSTVVLVYFIAQSLDSTHPQLQNVLATSSHADRELTAGVDGTCGLDGTFRRCNLRVRTTDDYDPEGDDDDHRLVTESTIETRVPILRQGRLTLILATLGSAVGLMGTATVLFGFFRTWNNMSAIRRGINVASLVAATGFGLLLLPFYLADRKDTWEFRGVRTEEQDLVAEDDRLVALSHSLVKNETGNTFVVYEADGSVRGLATTNLDAATNTDGASNGLGIAVEPAHMHWNLDGMRDWGTGLFLGGIVAAAAITAYDMYISNVDFSNLLGAGIKDFLSELASVPGRVVSARA
jgi:hypothetical protein